MKRNLIYTPLVYLDACVFISFLNGGKNSPPNGYKIATKAMLLTYDQKIHVVISEFTDIEVKDDHPHNKMSYSELLRNVGVWRINSKRVSDETIIISKRLVSKFNLDKLDAEHLAFAAASKCIYFCTFDSDMLDIKDALETELNMGITSDLSELTMLIGMKI